MSHKMFEYVAITHKWFHSALFWCFDVYVLVITSLIILLPFRNLHIIDQLSKHDFNHMSLLNENGPCSIDEQ